MADDIRLRLLWDGVSKFITDSKEAREALEKFGAEQKKVAAQSKASSKDVGALGGSFLSLKSAVGGYWLYQVARQVTQFGVSVAETAVTATAALEQVRSGFTHMLKSKDAAKQLTDQLQAFADVTPFQTADIDKWSQTLIGTGMKAKQIIPTLTALGDAVADVGGTPEQMSGSITALMQIASRAKLSAQELNQLANNGIFARDILAKGLGMSTGSLMQFLDKGGTIGSGVAIPILLKGLESQHAGALNIQSQTITGLWSTFKDKLIGVVRADPDSPFAIAVRSWLKRLVDDMPAIQAWIQGWFLRIWDLGGALGKVVAQIRGATAGVIGAISSAGSSGGPQGAGKQIGGDIQGLITGSLAKMGEWIRGIDWFTAGQSVGSQVAPFILGILSGLLDPATFWQSFKKHWWDMILAVLSLVGVGKVAGPVEKVLAKMPILKWFAPFFKAIDKVVGPFSRAIFGAIDRAFMRAFPETSFKVWLFFAKLVDKLKRAPGAFKGLTASLLEGAFYGIFRGVAAVGRMFRDSLYKPLALFFGVYLIAVMKTGWDKIKAGAKGFWTWLSDGFLGVVNGFIDALNGILSVSVAGHMIGPNIGHVGGPPKAARGGTAASSGLVEVGDAGRELLSLPRGASLMPLQRAQTAALSTDGGNMPAWNLYLDSRQLRYVLERRQDTATARA